MDLSVITVTYQSEAYIDGCIMSVIAHTTKCTYEHIIVDNGSTDGTVDLIEGYYSNYVHLIKNQKNTGFAHANNQAVKRAQGRYLLFLNPDMQICSGSLDSLIEWMEGRPEVGIAGCKLLSHLHTPHPALRPCKFPSLRPYLPSFLKLRPFFCFIHPQFFYPSFEDDKEQSVDVVRGAFMLMRKEVVDTLGFAFNPSYFILLEDIDICRTMKHLGYQVVYNPTVSCIDHFGRSFLHQSKPWRYLQVGRSLKTYVQKWHSPFHLIWLNIIIVIGFLLRIPEWGWKDALKALKSGKSTAKKRMFMFSKTREG
jgi:GT2 family glycosyltransferase